MQLLSHYHTRIVGRLVLAIATYATSSARVFADTPTPLAGQEIDFDKEVRPIFTKHCTACHGGVKEAGEVSFVTPDAILPPDGWVVEPGEPDDSVLIERVESDDPDVRMPPPDHGGALSTHEIAILRQWITQGAKWRGHWAYEQPSAPRVPQVTDVSWPRNEIDKFVLARLEAEGLQPSPKASPERWLRRVTLDLTGLPPTPAERTAFLADQATRGDAAFAAVADRLLQSPAYGERWASVWLDQVRYADSRGLGMDGPRSVWKYRDWVIKAFNADMPFDAFTVKQFAGDLLPDPSIDDLVATAAHRLTQANEEGGTDDEEFRIAAVLDRVNASWQAWQGVTFGCVQCHDHPYDPFKHEEYYQFAAFFNNTRDCDLNDDWPTIQAPLDEADYQRATELDREIDAIKEQLWQQEMELIEDADAWSPIRKMAAKTNNSTQVRVAVQPDHAEYHTVDTVSRGTKFILDNEVPEAIDKITAIRFTGMPLDPDRARIDSEWGFVLSHFQASWVLPGEETTQPIEIEAVMIDEVDPYHDPMESLNPKSNSGFSAYTRIHFPRTAVFVLKEPAAVPEGATLRVSLKHDVFILAAFPLVARRGHIAVSDDPRFTVLQQDATRLQQRATLKELTRQRKQIKSATTPVLHQRPDGFTRPSNVFIRGLFLTKGQSVTPGTPQSLPPLENDVANRLSLAQWIVNPNNPLTSRVAVNRVWSRLFGIGLVATEEDFGSSGERPSHPGLLDYLALRFQNQHDYRFKPLMRDIVLSQTYRQSSAIREELLERDSQNRLLARGPRHRLSAEMIRDQALACAGLLSDKMGGPPVRPTLPEGVWKPFAAWDKWKTPDVGDPDRYRRAIYTYTKRSIPYPMFASFDSPSREFCAPRRLRSNTPLQALMTLNDQTFQECAAGLAQRMLQHEGSRKAQLRHGFLVVTCRDPSDAELADLQTLAGTFTAEESDAAMTTVATVLLNLDEVMAK